jgi:hypothetical protein
MMRQHVVLSEKKSVGANFSGGARFGIQGGPTILFFVAQHINYQLIIKI